MNILWFALRTQAVARLEPSFALGEARVAGKDLLKFARAQFRKNPPIIGSEWDCSRCYRLAADVFQYLARDVNFLRQRGVMHFTPIAMMHSMATYLHARFEEIPNCAGVEVSGCLQSAGANKETGGQSTVAQFR